MSTAPLDDDEWGDEDLFTDDLKPRSAPKKGAVPMKRTAKQIAAAEKRAREKAEADALAVQRNAATARAAMLAQIVNLHIAGHSLEAIGASIGASADEVDRMLANETQRYVKTQPALRTYVRNFVSGKYSDLLDAVWDQAVDKSHKQQLEYVDRAQRIIAQMGRLHGAEAPTQTEMKIEAAPEAVERLVAQLAAGQGLAYDDDIFDAEVVEEMTEAVHALPAAAAEALEVSGNLVEESDGDDDF